jgi:hypothetical protein
MQLMAIVTLLALTMQGEGRARGCGGIIMTTTTTIRLNRAIVGHGGELHSFKIESHIDQGT